MTTGDFWNTFDPRKPWGVVDPQDVLDLPVEIEDWLTSLGSSYSDHEVIADAPLEVVSSVYSQDIIMIRVRVLSDPKPIPGKRYGLTIRLKLSNGQQNDRTLWLEVAQR